MDATNFHHLNFPVPDGEPRLYLRAHFATVDVYHDHPGEISVEFAGGPAFEPGLVESSSSDDGRSVAITVPQLGSRGADWVDWGDTVRRIFSAFGRETHLEITAHVPPDCELEISVLAGNITINGPSGRVKAETGGGRIRLQHATETHLKTSAGDIQVGTAGDSEIRTLGGNIEAGILGRSSLRTGGGNIRVNSVTSAMVSTGGGNVVVDNSEGELDVQTGAGDVSIGRCSVETRVRSGAGNITATVADGSITAKAGAGNITVTVPPDVPVWQDLDSSFGKVRSRVEGRGAPAEGEPYVQVRARTGTGNIVLTS